MTNNFLILVELFLQNLYSVEKMILNNLKVSHISYNIDGKFYVQLI